VPWPNWITDAVPCLRLHHTLQLVLSARKECHTYYLCTFFPLPIPAWYNLLVALQASPSAQPSTAHVVTERAIGEFWWRPHCYAICRNKRKVLWAKVLCTKFEKGGLKPGFPCAFCVCLGLSAVGPIHRIRSLEYIHATDGMGDCYGSCWTSKHSNQQFGRVAKKTSSTRFVPIASVLVSAKVARHRILTCPAVTVGKYLTELPPD
ncbi:hypothetical protein CTA2_9392, partial [Colletotrichum tanaceti]